MKDGPFSRGGAITSSIKKERLMVPYVDVFKCPGLGHVFGKVQSILLV
jgi:hypothetical protein